MDKKIGLEHTIRKLMSESLGGGVTTDKFSKTPKPFFKPVHIEPKKAGEHVNGTSSVRAARNAQLSRDSETVKEEEQLDEYAGVAKLIGKAAPYVDDAARMLDDLLKTKPKSFEPPSAPVKPKPPKPAVQPTPVAPPPPKPVVQPAPAAPPAPPVVKPAAPPVVKPAAPPIPNQAPAVIKAPPVSVPGLSTTPDNKTKPEKKTGTVPGPAPSAAPSGDKNKGGQPNKEKTRDPKRNRARLPFPTLTIDPAPLSTGGGYVPVDTYTHMAQDRRTYGESMEADDKRENIEAVPRRNSRNRTRQAEIIRKIIEEKKNKKKIVSTVNVNPELKNQEPDQN